MDHRGHDRSINSHLQSQQKWVPKVVLVGWGFHICELVRHKFVELKGPFEQLHGLASA